MKFNINLKLVRENKGISIKTLAEAIDVKPYTITDWETGRSEPSIKNLIKLSNYFDVSIDFLIGNTLKSEEYNEIINIINKYQESMLDEELTSLLSDLSLKNQEKLINIMKNIKKEIFNK